MISGKDKVNLINEIYGLIMKDIDLDKIKSETKEEIQEDMQEIIHSTIITSLDEIDKKYNFLQEEIDELNSKINELSSKMNGSSSSSSKKITNCEHWEPSMGLIQNPRSTNPMNVDSFGITTVSFHRGTYEYHVAYPNIEMLESITGRIMSDSRAEELIYTFQELIGNTMVEQINNGTNHYIDCKICDYEKIMCQKIPEEVLYAVNSLVTDANGKIIDDIPQGENDERISGEDITNYYLEKRKNDPKKKLFNSLEDLLSIADDEDPNSPSTKFKSENNLNQSRSTRNTNTRDYNTNDKYHHMFGLPFMNDYFTTSSSNDNPGRGQIFVSFDGETPINLDDLPYDVYQKIVTIINNLLGGAGFC